MAACNIISSGIPLDCDKPAVAGVNDRLFLFNFADKGTITKTTGNPISVEAITLAAAKVIYEFEGQNNSNEPSYTAVRQGFQIGFNHQLTFRVFSTDADSKKILNDISRGRFVAILLNNDQTIEIYGYETGLIMPDGGLTRSLNDVASNGSFVLQLGTDTNITSEPFMPYSFVGTASPYSYASALADIEALL